MREQRRQWREHDARLAAAWRADVDADDEPDRVIVLPDVIVLPESGLRMSAPSH
jgi:hypothetical protein